MEWRDRENWEKIHTCIFIPPCSGKITVLKNPATVQLLVCVTLDRNLNFYNGANSIPVCHKVVTIIRRLRIWKNFVKYKKIHMLQRFCHFLRSSASNYGNTSQLKKLGFINLLKKVLQKSLSLRWFHNTVLEKWWRNSLLKWEKNLPIKYK